MRGESAGLGLVVVDRTPAAQRGAGWSLRGGREVKRER